MQREYQNGAVTIYFKDGIENKHLPKGIRPVDEDGLEPKLAKIIHVHTHTYASEKGCSKILELQLVVEKRNELPFLQFLDKEDIEGILYEFQVESKPERLVGAGLHVYINKYSGECLGISSARLFEKP